MSAARPPMPALAAASRARACIDALAVAPFTGMFAVRPRAGRPAATSSTPLVWSDELARYLFIWCAFLGWTIAARRRSHLAITLVADRSPPRVQGGVRARRRARHRRVRRRAGCATACRSRRAMRTSTPSRCSSRSALSTPSCRWRRWPCGAARAGRRPVGARAAMRAAGRVPRDDRRDARHPRRLVRRAVPRAADLCRDGARRRRVPRSVAGIPGIIDPAEDRDGGQLVSAARGAAVHPDGQHHELGRHHAAHLRFRDGAASAGCAAGCATPTSSAA